MESTAGRENDNSLIYIAMFTYILYMCSVFCILFRLGSSICGAVKHCNLRLIEAAGELRS